MIELLKVKSGALGSGSSHQSPGSATLPKRSPILCAEEPEGTTANKKRRLISEDVRRMRREVDLGGSFATQETKKKKNGSSETKGNMSQRCGALTVKWFVVK